MGGLADTQSLQRWWREHSELDLLVVTLEETMSRGSISAASAALEDLTEALEEHFGVEEDVYFPLVERLSAAHEPVLKAARLGHLKIRERLEDLRELVANGDMEPAHRGLALVLDRTRTHEIEEAKLIGELQNPEGPAAS